MGSETGVSDEQPIARSSGISQDGKGNHDPSSSAGLVVQLAGAVIGALGTGVGILGLVALFGGLKMLARLRAAGLPGTDGVATMPRGALVSVGADELVPVVLVGAAAVLVIWLVPTLVGRRRDSQDEAIPASAVTSGRTAGLAVVAAGVGAAVAFAFYAGLAGHDAIVLNGVLSIAGAAALGCAAAWVAHRQGHRMAPAVLVFAVSLVVGGLLSYWTNLANPELRPAAVLRADGSLVRGAWIARSDGWFYLGHLRGENRRGRFVAVRENSVRGFSIGQYESLGDVAATSSRLAARLPCELERTRC
jgi:hypothetical protein